MAYPEDNLKNREATQFRTGPQQVETAKKGGKASGAARRKKGAAKKLLLAFLAGKPQLSDKERKELEDFGYDPDDENLTNEVLCTLSLLRQVKLGNIQAHRLYLEMVEEDPKTLLEKEKIKVQEKAVAAIKNSDGFMEAMQGIAEGVFTDGGDTPDDLEDAD